MPIIFRCSACHSKIKAPSKKAGVQVSCPRCLQSVTVPQSDNRFQIGSEEMPASRTRLLGVGLLVIVSAVMLASCVMGSVVTYLYVARSHETKLQEQEAKLQAMEAEKQAQQVAILQQAKQAPAQAPAAPPVPAPDPVIAKSTGTKKTTEVLDQEREQPKTVVEAKEETLPPVTIPELIPAPAPVQTVKPQPKNEEKKAENVELVYFDKVLESYHQNAAAADLLYLNKRLLIKTPVNVIERGDNSYRVGRAKIGPRVTRTIGGTEIGETPPPSGWIEFPLSRAEEVAKIKQDTWIYVSAVCKGRVSDGIDRGIEGWNFIVTLTDARIEVGIVEPDAKK